MSRPGRYARKCRNLFSASALSIISIIANMFVFSSSGFQTFSWVFCGLGAVASLVCGLLGLRVAGKYRPRASAEAKLSRTSADVERLRMVRMGTFAALAIWGVAYWLVAGALIVGLAREGGWVENDVSFSLVVYGSGDTHRTQRRFDDPKNDDPLHNLHAHLF